MNARKKKKRDIDYHKYCRAGLINEYNPHIEREGGCCDF